MSKAPNLPLAGLLVIDMSQFLSGPSATLRLADLGARVIKVERPITGDVCRQLYISDLDLDGDSTLFHSINRNKEGFSADLKDPASRDEVLALIDRADVLVENFRPGVTDRLGVGYEHVRARNPGLVYASITGYGTSGPWKTKPGQDLLAQSISGLAWLSGGASDPPTPMGLAVADLIAGSHLVQGILAALIGRGRTGQGAHVEVSLLESILDLQFEVLTTHLNDGGRLPCRAEVNNAHAYLAAPYGIYRTLDGHIAIAMGSVLRLAELLELEALQAYADPRTWFTKRDEIKAVLAGHVETRPTADWLAILEPADVWCAKVLDWHQLLSNEGFLALDTLQDVSRDTGTSMRTTRCPIRIDGSILKSSRGAPRIGQHDAEIAFELLELEGTPDE